MKKIYLSVIGFAMVCHFGSHAQTRPDTVKSKSPYNVQSTPGTDSTKYKASN